MLKIFLLIIFLYLIIDALLPLIKKLINKYHDQSTIHKDNNVDNNPKNIDDEDIIDADFQELDDEQNEDN
ncbi:MAG: hypothetical protein U9R41_00680 [Candidatus Marinimicrobia bacterium]|nr:hypothetical protein [Candidatus Neomarinimicrobiota bacterium]